MDEKVIDDLVRRSLSGEVGAFDDLVALLYTSVYRFAFAIFGKREPAEDATQETFFMAWRRLKTFRGEGRFQAWLLAILSAHCNTVMRKASYGETYLEERQSLSVGLAAISDQGSNADFASRADWELDMVLRDLVVHLPDRQRTVLTLHIFGDLTIAEIALALKMSERTTRNQYYEGLSRLRKILQVKESR